MKTNLIIALDVDTTQQALDLVDRCGECNWYKVGLQLFTRSGPAVVDQLHNRGKNVFLDLKLHDIPNTVGKAAKAAADMGVSLCTLHASGGASMIEAARKAVEGSQTKLLAVTVLTSISNDVLQREIGLHESVEDTVRRYAGFAISAGAHGVVASPYEIGAIRSTVGTEPLIVTPGIRPSWSAADDQARFMTPAEAAALGASFIVVGRPITAHKNPTEAVRLVMEELS